MSSNGETIAVAEGTLYLIDFSLSNPGDYIITLSVIDVDGREGSDSVSVTVMPGFVPVQRTTWGAIKAMYGK